MPGLKQLQEQHPGTRDGNFEHAHSFSRLERLAVWVTDRLGTMGVGLESLRFDPAPAFVLWLFISNLIQLHLMPLIMVGQNLQDRFAELRAEADFEINKKAEREVETILARLAHQNDLILEILRRIEALEKARAT